MKRLTFAFGAVLCAATLVPAHAQVAPARVVTNVQVRHGDLDLGSAPGARAMLARLDAAATRACGGRPAPAMPGDQVGLAKQAEFRRCKAAAMESGTQRLGAPLVRTAWLGRKAPAAIQPDEPLAGTR